MQKLWSLRDNLRRAASAQELARTPGVSDTAQKVWDLLRLGGKGFLQVGVNVVAPGWGSIVVGAGHRALAPILDHWAADRATRRGMELLHPKTPLRNPLLEP